MNNQDKYLAPLLFSLGIYGIVFAYSNNFGYAFEIPKFLVFSFLVCVSSVLFIYKKPKLRFPTNPIILTSGLVSLFLLLLSTYNSTQGPVIQSLCILTLWGLLSILCSNFSTDFGQDLFLKKIIQYTLPLNAFVLIYLILTEYANPNVPVKAFFGNINLAGDFVAIAVLQTLFHIEIAHSKDTKRFLYFIMSLGICLLFYFSSRAAILATALAALYAIGSQYKIEFIRKNRYFIAPTLLCLLCIFFYYAKGINSLKTRFAMWGNTLELIKDNLLWGVGPGAFDLFFEKYNGVYYHSIERAEGSIVTSPHNFILETIAVVGFPCAISFFLFLGYLIYQIVKNSNPNTVFARRWSLTFILLFLVLLFFAFPQNIPTTLLYISLVTGIVISLQKNETILNAYPIKLILLMLSFITLGILGVKAYSEHLTAIPQNERLLTIEKACRLDIENWRACSIWTRMNIADGNIDEAERALSFLEKRFKNFHPDLILRGELNLKEKNIAKACYYFKQYDKLYYPNSSLNKFILDNCKDQL